jgi:hypothetical protein
MDAYLNQKGSVKPVEPKKPAPVIDKSEPWTPPNNMVKSSADDTGVEFKFGNNYQSE